MQKNAIEKSRIGNGVNTTDALCRRIQVFIPKLARQNGAN